MEIKEYKHWVAQAFNKIPIVRRVMADLETPLSTYLKLADAPFSYLLESVQGGEKWGRYSIIGLSCETILRVNDFTVSIEKQGVLVESHDVEDPLAFIENYKKQFRVPKIEGMPRFSGGLAGYFGYETVKYIEPRLNTEPKPDTIGCPEIMLMLSDQVVVFDNLCGTLNIIVHAGPEEGDYETALARIEQLAKQLKMPTPSLSLEDDGPIHETDFIPGLTKAEYEAAVERVKAYTLAGDIMQVVPSQRMSIPFKQNPIHLYRALRYLNPSPHMYFYNMGDFYIIGSSPEILTRVEDQTVTVRPIAGTRPRGKTDDDDKRLEQELLADPKEVAEHLMLIDLGRNDVGRISEIGSVALTQKMVVERYSHVMHIVSNVEGRLRPDVSVMDTLKATFPAGTLTGAPKIRAMEIISELEPVCRGVYSGAVGYLSWFDEMDTAIAIRTAVVKNETLYIQAGAGVVADSVPSSEWEETLNKGRAMFRAVAMVAAGLTPDA